MKIFDTAVNLLLLIPCFVCGQDTLIATELLCRPTDHSITLNVVTGYAADGFIKYGTTSGVYPFSSDTVHITAEQPLNIVADKLSANTRYYYCLCYRRSGSPTFIIRDEHTFHTQRAHGSTFNFIVEADPHLYDKKGSAGMMRVTMQNEAQDTADFLLDLGDTFGDDHVPSDITKAEADRLHLYYRPFLGIVCHSTPFFFCMGNHEGESGYWLLQNPPDNMAVNSTLSRKFYYPNPVPDSFYSGNTISEGYGIGHPENYYAFEWGDALIVVLDAYRGYTSSAKPTKWNWTLGKSQFDWFKETLEGSSAQYKFVFAHHILGESRGGAAVAYGGEWGDVNNFEANRPGWGGVPIHQLMVANKVTIFFQGHDHLFAKEILDGVVYQEVPMPSDSTYIIGTRDNGAAYTGDTMSSSGHLRVTVSPEKATVDYVRAWMPADVSAQRVNGNVAYTYSITPSGLSILTSRKQTSSVEVITELAFVKNVHTSRICFSLATQQTVGLEVFDLGGRVIWTKNAMQLEPGRHTIELELENGEHSVLGQGAIIIRLTAGSQNRTVVASTF